MENLKDLYEYIKNNNLFNLESNNIDLNNKYNEFIKILKENYEIKVGYKWTLMKINELYNKLPYLTDFEKEEIILEIERNKINEKEYLIFADFLKKKSYDRLKLDNLLSNFSAIKLNQGYAKYSYKDKIEYYINDEFYHLFSETSDCDHENLSKIKLELISTEFCNQNYAKYFFIISSNDNSENYLFFHLDDKTQIYQILHTFSEEYGGRKYYNKYINLGVFNDNLYDLIWNYFEKIRAKELLN